MKKEVSEEEQHHGLGDPALLEKIDRLFACNVGEHVNLPQLVVVGDQSSGKSSVLEGLMKLPFPRDSGLCTRFATQIIFRRSLEQRITVSIIPDANATSEHADKVRAWSVADLKVLDASSFSRIMAEVHDTMGLSDKGGQPSGTMSMFSNDVLRLEISGPAEEHLSVIDVPGIFKNTTAGMTTKADINLVRSMVQGYMENPRSVMLTVIPANVDIATQEILELAADADPEGHRTLGVLTKPDLVDKGAESRVVDLIAGRAHVMQLGWHLVRNPGQQQLMDPSHDRQALETEFFRTQAPWNSLDKSKVGVGALRTRLQDVLATHIRREFPKVRLEINKKLKVANACMKALGMERETPEKQSTYLVDLATRFQKIATDALDAKYGSSDLFDQNSVLKLATAVTSRNLAFGTEVDRWGQEFKFSGSLDEEKPAASDESDFVHKDEPTEPSDADLEIRKVADPLELDGILHAQEIISGCKGGSIIPWLQKVYDTSRGFDLGTFNSSVTATAMKAQSGKWSALALGYVSDVISITHNFIKQLLALVCEDERVASEILSTLLDRLTERYVTALNHVRFLLHVERTGTPMTLNHYFNDNLQKCRQKRLQAHMTQMSIPTGQHGAVVKVADLTAHSHSMSNDEHVVQDIHDILCSYYKVARKRFVDCVCMQAVDHYLIHGPETPLTLFSPSFVGGLGFDDLERIAGEENQTKRRRHQLKKEIESLEAGKKILL